MTESTSRRPAYARLLDCAVRILAVRDHSEQELRRNSRTDYGQKWPRRD